MQVCCVTYYEMFEVCKFLHFYTVFFCEKQYILLNTLRITNVVIHY
jgi:hypothetical protein